MSFRTARAEPASRSTVSLGMRVIFRTSAFSPAASTASRNAGKCVGVADDFEARPAAAHVFSAGFQGKLHQRVLIRLIGGDFDEALAVEHPGNAAGGAEFSARNLEDFAHFAGRSIAVVGEDFAEDRHAVGAVAFVENFFEVHAFQLAGAFLDGPVDRVLGHVAGFGVDDGVAQAQIGVRIATANLRGDDDRLGQLAPKLAAPDCRSAPSYV